MDRKFRSIFENIISFQQFEEKIKLHSDRQEIFSWFASAYFIVARFQQVKIAMPLANIPEQLRFEAKIAGKTQIDGLLETRTGHRYAFKAIFSDEPQSELKFQTVSDFLYEGNVEKHVVFTTNHDLHVYLENFLALHVNGRMNSTEREQILKIFEKSERALLSNARCLTEGIDVPAVDLVAFIHQKRSVIDIVQAAGRCMN